MPTLTANAEPRGEWTTRLPTNLRGHDRPHLDELEVGRGEPA